MLYGSYPQIHLFCWTLFTYYASYLMTLLPITLDGSVESVPYMMISPREPCTYAWYLLVSTTCLFSCHAPIYIKLLLQWSYSQLYGYVSWQMQYQSGFQLLEMECQQLSMPFRQHLIYSGLSYSWNAKQQPRNASSSSEKCIQYIVCLSFYIYDTFLLQYTLQLSLLCLSPVYANMFTHLYHSSDTSYKYLNLQSFANSQYYYLNLSQPVTQYVSLKVSSIYNAFSEASYYVKSLLRNSLYSLVHLVAWPVASGMVYPLFMRVWLNYLKVCLISCFSCCYYGSCSLSISYPILYMNKWPMTSSVLVSPLYTKSYALYCLLFMCKYDLRAQGMGRLPNSNEGWSLSVYQQRVCAPDSTWWVVVLVRRKNRPDVGTGGSISGMTKVLAMNPDRLRQVVAGYYPDVDQSYQLNGCIVYFTVYLCQFVCKDYTNCYAVLPNRPTPSAGVPTQISLISYLPLFKYYLEYRTPYSPEYVLVKCLILAFTLPYRPATLAIINTALRDYRASVRDWFIQVVLVDLLRRVEYFISYPAPYIAVHRPSLSDIYGMHLLLLLLTFVAPAAIPCLSTHFLVCYNIMLAFSLYVYLTICIWLTSPLSLTTHTPLSPSSATMTTVLPSPGRYRSPMKYWYLSLFYCSSAVSVLSRQLRGDWSMYLQIVQFMLETITVFQYYFQGASEACFTGSGIYVEFCIYYPAEYLMTIFCKLLYYLAFLPQYFITFLGSRYPSTLSTTTISL